jgi:hypothetical protein
MKLCDASNNMDAEQVSITDADHVHCRSVFLFHPKASDIYPFLPVPFPSKS